ncbi:MAG: hypothetical protein JWO67_761, partial [Streptosporangiaceae bacterium]|nr:hypothetical protein [Streptosporangiaceae bacterium]
MSVVGVAWTGVDGSTWDLGNGTQGVYLAQGVSGLHLPSFKQQTSQAARVPGQRYLGSAYSARDVILPINIGDAGGSPRTGAAWQSLEDAWWQSLSPEATGTLTVTTDTGSRSLTCRLGAAPDPVFQSDPSLAGFASYALTLEADQPFWTGPDVTAPAFTPPVSTAQPYYGGTGGTGFGPPFYISAPSALANAVISNPGDRPAFSRWTFTGPGQVTFTIGGHGTQLPMLSAGQVISLDTNPVAPRSL